MDSAASHRFSAIVESVNHIERTVGMVSLKQRISQLVDARGTAEILGCSRATLKRSQWTD